MIVANFVTQRPTMSETKTYEDFYKFLGASPHKLGIVSRMYPQNTATYLTESLKNVFYNEAKGANKFQSIDAMMFEWEVESNYIKRIEFADVPEGDGENGSEIIMAFKERYYEKYDIFKIDETMQQCMVVSRPVRKADNYWQVTVRLIDNDYSTTLDESGCQPGMTTRFQSNAMPELSEEGYCKSQSNIEKHRNYITTFRNDISWSSLYAAHEDVFIKIGEGKDKNSLKEVTYKMDKKEKELLENFMTSRNQGLLFNKTNIDVNGKPTIVDPDTGRPVYIGDGLIPQVERFASKYVYTNKPTIDVFHTIMQTMNEKAEQPTGNKYMFICNEKLWHDIQHTFGHYLADYKTDGAYMYSKAANDYVKVGATFVTYEFAGNQISFSVDRTFTREYGDKGYGLCLDLTADLATGKPAMAMFSLKGCDVLTSKYPGVGGMGGTESGIVSSPVAGSKLIMMGYAGIGVFAPYRSFVLRQA